MILLLDVYVTLMIYQFIDEILPYSYERLSQVHQAEANAIFAAHLNCKTISGKPIYCHVSGIPGSGKSTYIENILQYQADFFADAVIIQFDEIMQSLQGYQAAVNKNSNLNV